jgi:drug/metabolite transporter (DMT)-like permease
VTPPDPSSQVPSLLRGRLSIALAAVLWSTSGGLVKLLTQDTPLQLHVPRLTPLQLACFRLLFAGLVLLPTVRRSEITFRPLMLVMVGVFVLMNVMYIRAMALGTAANAVLLQYSAPMWMYLAGIWLLGERVDRRGLAALALGLFGVAVIVVGNWTPAQMGLIALGLGSGVTYAGILICLRLLRDCSSELLTVLNHLAGGLILLPFVLVAWSANPTPGQWLTLILLGGLQMGVPYLLVARALRVVSPHEAGIICLLEPLLNPAWAYLAVGELPSSWTFLGGAFILGALAWRYWPRQIKSC